MSDDEKIVISAKEAIKKGFELFNEFYSDSPAKYVLLDGVEYNDASDEWIVTIGFDIGRQSASGFVFGDEKNEPIRERRRIHLKGSDGEFLRIS